MSRICVLLAWLVAESSSLPLIKSYSFRTVESKVISGQGVKTCKSITVGDEDRVGDLTVVTQKAQGSCWGANYAHTDFPIDRMTMDWSDGKSYPAYRVGPHQTPANKFSASPVDVYLRISVGDVVMSLDSDSNFVEVSPEGDTDAIDGFRNMGIVASSLSSEVILFIVPANTRVSVFPTISSTVYGAWVAGQSGANAFSLEARFFPVGNDRTPHDPARHWTYGPGQHSHSYQDHKRFVAVSRRDGAEGIVWPDAVSNKVHVTWFAPGLDAAATTTLLSPAESTERWYAATSNDNDAIVVLTVDHEDRPVNASVEAVVRVYKFDSATGAQVLAATIEGTNTHRRFASGASMAWAPDSATISVMMSRLMPEAKDGLNHQGCITFQLNASTLELLGSYGLRGASSHSWSNSIVLREDGNFLGLDLGDNYPRGINVHLMTTASQIALLSGTPADSKPKQSRVVYTFKTRHGDVSRSFCDGFKYYYSRDGKDFCQRSNDNRVYTEIGHPGIVEIEGGFIVFFSGEREPLDNTMTGSAHNAARNLGFVKVSKDLSDILSTGDTEEGEFYNYGGGKVQQTNKGVNWLTSFSVKEESVSRVKTLHLSPTRIVLMYEVWTSTRYVRTEFMEVDTAGGMVRHVSKVCYPLRLAIADDARVIDGKIVAYAGTTDGHIVRYQVCFDDACNGPDGGDLPAPTADGCPLASNCGRLLLRQVRLHNRAW